MQNAADRKQIRAAEKAAKLAERNRGEVIAALANTEPGRRYLWDRLAEANVFSSTYHDNPQRMAFSEGLRSSGLALMEDFMRYAPDQFILAMREANGRRTESDTIAADRANGKFTGSEESRRQSEEFSGTYAEAGAESFGDPGDEGTGEVDYH